MSKSLIQDFHDGRIASLMSFLTSVPRATQLLDKEPSHVLLVNSLEHEFKRYLQQVHRHNFRQDKRYHVTATRANIQCIVYFQHCLVYNNT